MLAPSPQLYAFCSDEEMGDLAFLNAGRKGAPVTDACIFVVDDDASVRRALERLIRSLGMSVTSFASAEDLLLAELPSPDCLIVDVRMPGMSGLDLQQHLLAHEQHVPLIFISAQDDPFARRSAMAAGAVEFLLKPFEEHALLDVLERVVAHRNGRN